MTHEYTVFIRNHYNYMILIYMAYTLKNKYAQHIQYYTPAESAILLDAFFIYSPRLYAAVCISMRKTSKGATTSC